MNPQADDHLVDATHETYQSTSSIGDDHQQNLANFEITNNPSSQGSFREQIKNRLLGDLLTNKIPILKKKNIIRSESMSKIREHSEQDNHATTFIAPLPKCEWSIYQPTHLGEMYDDVIRYILMFLTPKEIVGMGLVNRRMREISSSDDIWLPIYTGYTFKYVTKDETITQGYRSEFIKTLKRNETILVEKQVAEEWLPSTELQQMLFQYSYGCFSPVLFLISIFVFSILVPLMMDEIINVSNIGYYSVPFFLALAFFLFTSISLIFDPYYLNNYRSKYAKLVDITPERPIMAEEFKYTDWTFQNQIDDNQISFDDGWKEIINLWVWNLWIWMLFVLCFLAKYMWFSRLYAPFSVLFIPCYAYAFMFCIAPLIYYSKRGEVESSVQKAGYFTYILNTLLVFLSALQILLIGLKLDSGEFTFIYALTI